MRFSLILSCCLFVFVCLLALPTLSAAESLDSLLSKTYNAMHEDCMSDRYLDDDLIKAMFVEMSTLKVMNLLRERDIQDLVERYVDPKLLNEKRKKIRKKYDKWNDFVDLQGRGFSFDDLCNVYVAGGLMLYRYMHSGGADYGLIPEKNWNKVNENVWRLIFRYGERVENFYFRRVGTHWYLTDEDYIKR